MVAATLVALFRVSPQELADRLNQLPHLFQDDLFAVFAERAGQAEPHPGVGRLVPAQTVILGVVLAMAGLVALMTVRDTTQIWQLYAYAICTGFATGIVSPAIIASTGDLFHGKDIGAISALVLTGVGFGGAIGPWLGGFIYDIQGSYNAAFLVSMAAFALAGISFWIAAPRNAAKLRAKMLKEAGQ